MKKFKPESPDPFLKTPEDMAPAKFGHLNEIVREINAGGGGGSLTLTTTGSGAATLVGNNLNIPTPPLLTTSVTVSAAEIIANAGVTILPAPAATKYYVIHNATVKFKGGTVAFDAADAWNTSVSVGTAATATLNPGFTVFNIPTNLTDAILCVLNGSINAGQSLSFNPHVAGSITTGDSEIVFDITYEIKDF